MYAIPHTQGHGGASLEVEFELLHQNPVPKRLCDGRPIECFARWTVVHRSQEAQPNFTYRLVKGKGDDDNKLFNINGDKLVTKAVLTMRMKTHTQYVLEFLI